MSLWTGEQAPTQYAILDIDGDGAAELVLSSDTDEVGFSTFEVLTVDAETGSVKPVIFRDAADMETVCVMCYNGLSYSGEHHALVYKSMNNGPMFGSFEYHVIQGSNESMRFYVNYDLMTGSGEPSYTYSENGEAETISEEQYQAFREEAVPIDFQAFE